MPYFIKKGKDDEFCVHKGTEEKPGAVVKCHSTRNEAMGHMRALYANVEDVDKSVDKGADKATVTNTVGNLLHGSGGILNPMRGDGDEAETTSSKGTCACECGYSIKGNMVPCDMRTCPVCGKKMHDQKAETKPESDSEDEVETKATPTKAEQDGNHPAGHYLVVEDRQKPSTWHLRVRGTDGKPDHRLMGAAWAALHGGYRGNKYGGPGKGEALKKLTSLYKSEGMDIPGSDDKKSLSQFTVYKVGSTWRWLAISNVAIMDKEGEIVSEKAYDDAISWAYSEGTPGELDLVHVNGTDVGICDMMHRLGQQLVEGGYWLDTPMAKHARGKVQADPDHWGVSIKFVYDPDQFDGVRYTGGIRIPKRTILPRRMAASHGTSIVAIGGETMKAMDEETKVALAELGGLTPEQIAVLAEKQKSLPEEANVKTKEEEPVDPKVDETPTPELETVEVSKGWIKTIKDYVSEMLTPESEETTEPAVEEQQKADQEVPPETPTPEPTMDAVTEEQLGEQLKVYGTEMAKVFSTALAETIVPLRDKLTEMEKRLVETEKDVETKVLARLETIPPVVKVAASEVSITQTEAGTVGLPVDIQPVVESALKKLMGDIADEAKRSTSTERFSV